MTACHYLQKSIDAISKWADNHGFRFSSSKTVAVRFTRSTRKETIPNIKLKDDLIPYEKEAKFLGMIFDSKLTWNSHIDSLKLKVKKSLNILKVVSGFDWGADKKSLLKLYDSLCRSKLDYGCQVYSSACKSKLKELDVIHNMGLRICTGAYRTSPIESIYVDSDELPLDLRREELGLRYTMRLKSSRENPTFNILKECDATKFGERSSKPFQIRQLENLSDEIIQRQKVEEVKPSSVPPWLVPVVDICPKTVNKKQPEEQIKAMFLEHDLNHKGRVKMYTDGSKSENGVGSAVVCGNKIYEAKLPKSASIYTAEMTAIVIALEIVEKSNKKRFVIYSDSLNSLESLKQLYSNHPLVQKAQERLFWISYWKKSVCFCWIPAHVGIQGNEAADRYAKEAAASGSSEITKVSHVDMKNPIKSYIWNKWQARWASPDHQ